MWQVVVEPYYDSHLHLTGKPDYVIKQGYTSIPVEVKTGRTPDAPYDLHIFQLAAYCVLIDRATGLRPPYGVLNYPERTYKIEFTEEIGGEPAGFTQRHAGQRKVGQRCASLA